MEEKKVKANPDYTASAKDLSRPAAVIDAYNDWVFKRHELEKAEIEIQGKIPTDLITARDEAQKSADSAYVHLKEGVERLGGFQDVEAGQYALQQRRETITYKPDLAKTHLEAKFLPAVIIEAVDTKVLDQLVKGGSIPQEAARQCGEVKETFAFIIK